MLELLFIKQRLLNFIKININFIFSSFSISFFVQNYEKKR